jgi:uncharacterized integral membrane protein
MNDERMWLDILVLILIVVAIFIIKNQADLSTINPADAIQALVGGF